MTTYTKMVIYQIMCLQSVFKYTKKAIELIIMMQKGILNPKITAYILYIK